MINVPYTGLVPAQSSSTQLPVMQAPAARTAAAMQGVTGALNNQRTQQSGILDAFMNRIPSQPAAQAPQPTTLFVAPGPTMTGIGGRQYQTPDLQASISMPTLPQSTSLSSYLPDWLSNLPSLSSFFSGW